MTELLTTEFPTTELPEQRAVMRLVRVDLSHAALPLSPVLAETLAPWPVTFWRNTASRGLRAGSAGEAHLPMLVLVRRQRPYALLGPRDQRLPDLAAGVRYLVSQGFPVYRRTGGGSLVLLDEGCVSFAVSVPCRDLTHVGRHVADLSAPVRMALERLGVQAAVGRAAGSYCEGPSDLVTADHRKVAGMAQAVRDGYAMVSGMLLVEQDPAWATAQVAAFEAAAGGDPSHLRADAVTSLRQATGRAISAEQAMDALVDGFGRWARARGLVLRDGPVPGEGTLTDAEWLRARDLNTVRRVDVWPRTAVGGAGAVGT